MVEGNPYSLAMELDGTMTLANGLLRLPHYQVYGTELEKNLMERFIQYLKDRTECFDDHFIFHAGGREKRIAI